jgi:hypothetical protein
MNVNYVIKLIEGFSHKINMQENPSISFCGLTSEVVTHFSYQVPQFLID